jgi:hypothetical protein
VVFLWHKVNYKLASEKSLQPLKYLVKYSFPKLKENYKMAKLVDVYRAEKQLSISRRQLPLIIDENLSVSIIIY